ncbi:MAG: low temperature requirement protein A [Acidimicrobiia bacterium]
MTPRKASRARVPRLSAELRERETVKPLELFFDLIFVLGFTQCTALMLAEPTWTGIGHGILVLAVLWWSWVGYAWLTSVIEPEEGAVRIAIFAAMTGLLIVALCVPEAFGDRALGFAIAYGVVRAGHIALFWIGSRDNPSLRRSVISLAMSTAIAIGLLVGASFLDGVAQAALWGVAVLVDWGGPAIFGVAGWRLVPAHFAERHNLVIILALGESIVALGVGARVDLTAPVLTVAVLGIGVACALWWIYFDVVALVTERRLTQAAEGRERNALARDSYSYLHFPMVAGIVLGAFGLEEALAHVDEPLDGVHAFALLGGTAIYLLAHVALRLRNARTINVERLALAVVLFGLIAAATHVDPLVTLIGVNVLLWAMIAYETAFVYDERRYDLRHGLEIDMPENG